MTDALDRLRQRRPVGENAAAFLDRLPPAQRDFLVQAVLDAEAAQRRRLERALDRALGFIPSPLRGRARKLLFD